DDSGSDAEGDGSEINPYGTITRALQAARNGDTIVVHDGTYNESVVLTKDVTVTSVNGPEATILQLSGGDGFAIQPASSSYGTRRVTGFTITGAAHGISVSGMAGGLIYLENNIISGCGDGIYVDNHSAGTIYIQKNTIVNNAGAGIKLGESANADWVKVKWNNIAGNGTGIVHSGTGQVDAPLNYWGSPHGPSHDGVNYGDTVTGDVDFQPWLVAESAGEEITTELDIAAPALGDGYLGLEYLAELPIQPNVGSTLQWSLYSGSLPGGMEIVSGKTLYGTPAAASSYSFALEASNGTQAVYRDVSLNVAATYTGSGPAVVTRSPAPYETGVAVDVPMVIVFNEAVQLSDNYQGYITITNPKDPYETVYKVAGVQTTVINNDTLVIDPTYNLKPSTTYQVKISAGTITDVEGNSFAGSWSFTTGDQSIPLAITNMELPPAAEGQAYSAQLAAAGGSGRYSWSVVSGSLPQGLTLASLSGEIAGAPAAAGSYSFTVRVTDGLYNTAEKSFTLTVEGVDTTSPTLVSTSPAHNATGVSRDIMITVEFNEPIQAGSNFDGISMGLVSLDKTIEGNLLKLTPADLLAETNLRDLASPRRV
ncbi:MAG: Ig-like domain-containing protein, partial [Moorella sp. (in: Bacteria)]|nr:Ig-like domain-containing protein [Moorella sp. (in: firmicutes)]